MSNLPLPSPSEYFSDEDRPSSSATPTANAPRPSLSRAGSRNSGWSDAPHHNQGTSYFPAPSQARATSPVPRRVATAPRFHRSTSATSVRRSGVRSNSVSSAHAPLDEANEDDELGEGEGTIRRGRADEASSSDDEAPARPRPSKDKYTRAQTPAEEFEDDPITLKSRQSLINVEHPFGLPIWKPALYKKSRTVTRDAETALHSVPSAAAERHLLPGNILWTVLFGWWLALVCFAVALVLAIVPKGGRRYAWLIYGLGWYLGWPFGKYLEGDTEAEEKLETVTEDDEEDYASTPRERQPSQSSEPSTTGTIRAADASTATAQGGHPLPVPTELAALLPRTENDRDPRIFPVAPLKSYGSTRAVPTAPLEVSTGSSTHWLGKACFWLFFLSIIAPLMLIVCLICWGLVITIPMAKLNWALLKHLFKRPMKIRFCAAPPAQVVPSPSGQASPAGGTQGNGEPSPTLFTLKQTRLKAGQAAPSGSPRSTVLLCVYKATGRQYYKYTVGGVNIMFVNLMPLVFFAIIDGFLLLPWVEHRHHQGHPVTPLIEFLASRAFIFVLSLASVIPLSYFIGMAVASISAQSSIGMGAVINATFGSIIEIILYSIALTQGKGHLVEGSIVGSLLAGVLLMPGASMCSGAVVKKEQKFNAKSAGVTSTMLIMAIIGTLTPTMFYQTYGNFKLVCEGCPATLPGASLPGTPWVCKRCYYKHPNPVDDPFYQETVRPLMYFCASILLFAYLVGLWFSLRTHASQIWQNPQQLMHPLDIGVQTGPGGARPMSIYHRLLTNQLSSTLPTTNPRRPPSLHRKPSTATTTGSVTGQRDSQPESHLQSNPSEGAPYTSGSSSPTQRRTLNPPVPPSAAGYTPFFETVNQAAKTNLPVPLPPNLTADDFTRAVAVATVSALRHQQPESPVKLRGSAHGMEGHDDGGHGGHEAPSWSRFTSASVLLACTALYAAIAEILVDVVDVVLEGSGIDEKFLGITLFALVPNTTEFMNAMSFAINGNIALSMEIGSAYALQVCLLQIPAMVAFSAWYDPRDMGRIADTFTLIFPRWDVIAIILSIFLLTYVYIEAKSNYHRGSTLILSYLVLTSGFYFAPQVDDNLDLRSIGFDAQKFSFLQTVQTYITSLWM